MGEVLLMSNQPSSLTIEPKIAEAFQSASVNLLCWGWEQNRKAWVLPSASIIMTALGYYQDAKPTTRPLYRTDAHFLLESLWGEPLAGQIDHDLRHDLLSTGEFCHNQFMGERGRKPTVMQEEYYRPDCPKNSITRLALQTAAYFSPKRALPIGQLNAWAKNSTGGIVCDLSDHVPNESFFEPTLFKGALFRLVGKDGDNMTLNTSGGMDKTILFCGPFPTYSSPRINAVKIPTTAKGAFLVVARQDGDVLQEQNIYEAMNAGYKTKDTDVILPKVRWGSVADIGSFFLRDQEGEAREIRRESLPYKTTFGASAFVIDGQIDGQMVDKTSHTQNNIVFEKNFAVLGGVDVDILNVHRPPHVWTSFLPVMMAASPMLPQKSATILVFRR
jgi:hypothetical protein